MLKLFHCLVRNLCWRVIVLPFDVLTEAWMSSSFIHTFQMQFGGDIILMVHLLE